MKVVYKFFEDYLDGYNQTWYEKDIQINEVIQCLIDTVVNDINFKI